MKGPDVTKIARRTLTAALAGLLTLASRAALGQTSTPIGRKQELNDVDLPVILQLLERFGGWVVVAYFVYYALKEFLKVYQKAAEDRDANFTRLLDALNASMKQQVESTQQVNKMIAHIDQFQCSEDDVHTKIAEALESVTNVLTKLQVDNAIIIEKLTHKP